MSVSVKWGQAQSAASMVIAVAETAYINYATNKTLDAIYGPVADDDGDEAPRRGTSPDNPLSFGEPAEYSTGMTIVASPPVVHELDASTIESGLKSGWKTTITITNNSSSVLQLTPTAGAHPSNLSQDCVPVSGEGLQTITEAAGPLAAHSQIELTLGFACEYQTTVNLELTPDSAIDSTWYRGDISP